VIGAGFAGVACPRDLGRRGIAVTLIDTNTYHSPSTIHRDEVTPVDERVTETRSPSDPPPSTQ
jgi:NADH dehydrogenase FAD-containing subunit